MGPHKSRRLHIILIVAGLLCQLFAASWPVAAISGLILMVGGIVQGEVFCRCPGCGYNLMNIRGALPDYCPGCGERLPEE